MAIAFVQDQGNGSTGASVSTTLPGAITAGNLLVAFGYFSFNVTPSVTSSSPSQTFTLAGTRQVGTDSMSGSYLQIFYLFNAQAGSYALTLTATGNTGTIGIAVLEYSGLSLVDAGPLYSTATNTSSPSTSSLTTAAANTLVLGACLTSSQADSSAPWTERFDSGGVNGTWGQNGVAERIVSSTGSYSTPFTVTNPTDDSILGIVSFDGASAAYLRDISILRAIG